MNKEVARFVAATIILSTRGRRSFRGIAFILNEAGVPPPSGKGDWQANTVKRISDALDG